MYTDGLNSLNKYLKIAELAKEEAVYAHIDLTKEGYLSFRLFNIDDLKIYAIEDTEKFIISVSMPITVENLRAYLDSSEYVNINGYTQLKKITEKAEKVYDEVVQPFLHLNHQKEFVYTGFSLGGAISNSLLTVTPHNSSAVTIGAPPIFKSIKTKKRTKSVNYYHPNDGIYQYSMPSRLHIGNQVQITESVNQKMTLLDLLYFHNLNTYRVSSTGTNPNSQTF